MAHRKRFTKIGALAAALLALSLLFAACGSSDPNSNSNTGTNTNDALAQLISGMSDTQLAALAQGAASAIPVNYGNANGIQATGTGTVSIKPDIAVMNLGVETLKPTVTAARDEAATAIDAMITALKADGVADADLETQYYNIQPQYSYDQVTDTLSNGQKVTHSQQTLIGYQVTNTLKVTIHNLDNIGKIVDDAVTAGGDATRLNGLTFTVEDGSAAEQQARTAALADALAKANLYATQLDATRGKLISVVETSNSGLPQPERNLSLDAMAGAAPAPTTQIIAGNLQVTVTVQTVFAIQ